MAQPPNTVKIPEGTTQVITLSVPGGSNSNVLSGLLYFPSFTDPSFCIKVELKDQTNRSVSGFDMCGGTWRDKQGIPTLYMPFEIGNFGLFDGRTINVWVTVPPGRVLEAGGTLNHGNKS